MVTKFPAIILIKFILTIANDYVQIFCTEVEGLLGLLHFALPNLASKSRTRTFAKDW